MTTAELPFTLDCEPTTRGRMRVTAIGTDGHAITAETYVAGEGDPRRKVASLWAEDDRLRNGSPLNAKTVTRALEAAELKFLGRQRDSIETDGDSGETRQAASYVDGRIVAELAWNVETDSTDFILYDRDTKTVERANSNDAGWGLLVPPNCADVLCTPGGDIPGCILLPTVADKPGENEDALRDDVRRFINRYVELPEHGLTIAVEYVVLSWVHDAFDELAYLAFRTVDPGRGKSRALETIGALCYRPLFCGGGSTAAATLRLLDLFGGTLVADEFDGNNKTELGQEITRIINQGFQKRRPIVKCDGENNELRAFQCFGPKLFALRKRLGDDASESRTISVRMEQRTRSDIPLNLPREQFDREALALRNRLLYWRFANFGEARIDPSLADAGLEDRANQIGLPLLSVAGTDEARAAIVAALRDQQANTAADRADTLAGEVFRAVLATYANGDLIRPRDVAVKMNAARAEAAGIEEDKLGRRRLTKEQIGRILRNDLELPRVSRDKTGVRYALQTDRAIQLCDRFGEHMRDGVSAEVPGAPAATYTTYIPTSTPAEPYSETVRADSAGSVGSVGSDDRPPARTGPASHEAPIPLDHGDAAPVLDHESGEHVWPQRAEPSAAEYPGPALPADLQPFVKPSDVGSLGHREHLARIRKEAAAKETPTAETT